MNIRSELGRAFAILRGISVRDGDVEKMAAAKAIIISVDKELSQKELNQEEPSDG